MSIVIKGMEMPTGCATCKLFGEYGCPFIGAVGYALTRGKRNEDCPLIELPPHGDLIDRDEQIERAWRLNLSTRELIEEMLKTAPTILEAEVEE